MKRRRHEEHPFAKQVSVQALKPHGSPQLSHMHVFDRGIVRPDDRFGDTCRAGCVTIERNQSATVSKGGVHSHDGKSLPSGFGIGLCVLEMRVLGVEQIIYAGNL